MVVNQILMGALKLFHLTVLSDGGIMNNNVDNIVNI